MEDSETIDANHAVGPVESWCADHPTNFAQLLLGTFREELAARTLSSRAAVFGFDQPLGSFRGGNPPERFV